MNTQEKAVWQMMRDWAKKHLYNNTAYKIHLQRIESEITSQGISDLNGLINGVEAWVELKVVTGKKVDLSPKQVNWINARIKAGGNCWILARKPNKEQDQLFLWHGSKVQEVYKNGLLVVPDVRVVRYSQNRPFMWQHIFSKIFNCPLAVVGSNGVEEVFYENAALQKFT